MIDSLWHAAFICFRGRGTECYILNRKDVSLKCPILNTDDIQGALWVPNDGVCDLYKLCIALLTEARNAGI